ncbi:MAG: four helix bundle protein [Deltaproteobacteria bacterium]|nr:four helix bundle protein [Deltaproteobacteria bacterium]
MPKSFEELPVWQKARELVKYVYDLSKKELFCRDFNLVDQIRRSSTSVMYNISEGFERGSNTEFIQFLFIAKGSAGEARAQFYVALDQEYISSEEFQKGVSLCKDVSGQLSGLIDYLKGSRLKGEKFKKNYRSMKDEVEKITRQFNIQHSKPKS